MVLQLSYSSIGLINEKYVDSSVFLSNSNIRDLKTLIRFQALGDMSEIWSCQVQALFRVSPKCLWFVTFWICTLFIINGEGWIGWLIFLVSRAKNHISPEEPYFATYRRRMLYMHFFNKGRCYLLLFARLWINAQNNINFSIKMFCDVSYDRIPKEF